MQAFLLSQSLFFFSPPPPHSASFAMGRQSPHCSQALLGPSWHVVCSDGACWLRCSRMKEELWSFYAQGNWQLQHEISSQPAPRGLDLNLPEALGSKSQPEAVLQSSGDAAGDEQVHSAGRRHCSLCGTLSPDCGLAATV